MKRSSDPNRWRYGGIITAMRWESPDPSPVRLWSGAVDIAYPGDVVLVLHTGAEKATVAGIEHRGQWT